MKPAERARNTRPDTFREELTAHLLGGFVFSTPECFLMGRAISKDAPHELQADPWYSFDADEQDCWLVWLAAGDLSAIWRHVPYQLPWIAWARREGELKFFPFETVKASLAKFHNCG